MIRVYRRCFLWIFIIGLLNFSVALEEIGRDSCTQLQILHEILLQNDINFFPSRCFFLEPSEGFLNFDDKLVKSPIMLSISGFEPIRDQWFYALQPKKGVIENYNELEAPDQGWTMTTSVEHTEEDLRIYADAGIEPPKGFVYRVDRKFFEGDYAWFVLVAERK